MPWLHFFAARDDLLDLLEFALSHPGMEISESYSEFDRPLRRFTDPAELRALPQIGLDPHGIGAALQLALWLPDAGPRPAVDRIALKPRAVPGHTFREVIRGPGLFTLQCGGIHQRASVLTASALGWFTEAGARRKYLDPAAVERIDWEAHRTFAARLRDHVSRRLAVASVPGRPVLAGADRLRREGLALKDTIRAETAG